MFTKKQTDVRTHARSLTHLLGRYKYYDVRVRTVQHHLTTYLDDVSLSLLGGTLPPYRLIPTLSCYLHLIRGRFTSLYV
jgi:hypothetical protein